MTFNFTKFFSVVLFLLFTAATADDCHGVAPYVQLFAEIGAGQPPVSTVFNVPLFKKTCETFPAAEPLSGDGL